MGPGEPQPGRGPLSLITPPLGTEPIQKILTSDPFIDAFNVVLSVGRS